jgi:hypothetical protein
MKLNENFVLRQVAGTWVVLPLLHDTVDFNGVIRLNDSGVMLWQTLEQGGDREALVHALTSTYEVSAEQAANDVDEFLETLAKAGCIEI